MKERYTHAYRDTHKIVTAQNAQLQNILFFGEGVRVGGGRQATNISLLNIRICNITCTQPRCR